MTITDTRAATLHGRMRTARMIAGLEQLELATQLGVARNTLSNWERGVSSVPATVMIRWAEITKISLEWLAYGAGVRPEGFEPPAYCSVAFEAYFDDDNGICLACGKPAFNGIYCSNCGYEPVSEPTAINICHCGHSGRQHWLYADDTMRCRLCTCVEYIRDPYQSDALGMSGLFDLTLAA